MPVLIRFRSICTRPPTEFISIMRSVLFRTLLPEMSSSTSLSGDLPTAKTAIDTVLSAAVPPTSISLSKISTLPGTFSGWPGWAAVGGASVGVVTTEIPKANTPKVGFVGSGRGLTPSILQCAIASPLAASTVIELSMERTKCNP